MQRFDSSFRAHAHVTRSFEKKPLGISLERCVSEEQHDVAQVKSSEREDVPVGAILIAVNGQDCSTHETTFEQAVSMVSQATLPLELTFATAPTGIAAAAAVAAAAPAEEAAPVAHAGMGKRNRRDRGDKRVSMYAIEHDRKCTDTFWLVLFVAFWLGMLAIAAVGWKEGDPYRLLYGTDHNGQICGRGAQVGKHKLYYPQLQKDLLRAYTSDSAKYNPLEGGDPSLVHFYGVCVTTCPARGATVCTNKTATSAEQECFPVPVNTSSVLFRCLPFDDVNTQRTIECVEPAGATPPIVCGSAFACQALLEAQLIKARTECVRARVVETKTTEKMAMSNPVFDMLTASGAIVRRWFGDLALSTTPVLLCGGVLAMVLAFAYLFLLEHFVSNIVWGSFGVCYAMLLALTYVLGSNSGLFAKTQEQAAAAAAQAYAAVGAGTVESGVEIALSSESAALDDKERVYSQYAARALIAGCVVILFFMMHLRRRISLAIGILREASKAVQAMPYLLFFPVLPIVLAVALTVYWLAVAGFIASCGSIGDSELEVVDAALSNATFANASAPAQYLTNNNRIQGALLYHFFGLLWTKQFLHGVTVCVVAGAVSDYYWVRSEDLLARRPVWSSLRRAVRYHLGSVALGSLILAVVALLRYALAYVDRRTKSLQESHFSIRCAMRVLHCCMWCFEKCVKFVSEMGFITMAMQGGSFCHSSVKAFKLIYHNVGRVGTVTIISNFVLHLGAAIIVMLCTATMFVLIRQPIDTSGVFLLNDFSGELTNVSSPLLPIAITMLLSYAVCLYAFSVYQMAIDTILICFCEDEKCNKKAGAFFATDELLQYLDGPAHKLQFKHYHKRREGVEWIDKEDEPHDVHEDLQPHHCWSCEKKRDAPVREAEMTLQGNDGQRGNPMWSHAAGQVSTKRVVTSEAHA